MSTEAQNIVERDDQILEMENKPKSKIDEFRDKLKNQTFALNSEDIAAADSIEVESTPVTDTDPEAFSNFDSPQVVK